MMTKIIIQQIELEKESVVCAYHRGQSSSCTLRRQDVAQGSPNLWHMTTSQCLVYI